MVHAQAVGKGEIEVIEKTLQVERKAEIAHVDLKRRYNNRSIDLADMYLSKQNQIDEVVVSGISEILLNSNTKTAEFIIEILLDAKIRGPFLINVVEPSKVDLDSRSKAAILDKLKEESKLVSITRSSYEYLISLKKPGLMVASKILEARYGHPNIRK